MVQSHDNTISDRVVQGSTLGFDSVPWFVYTTESAARGYHAQHTVRSQAKLGGVKIVETLMSLELRPWWSATQSEGDSTVLVDHGDALALVSYRSYNRITVSVSSADPMFSIELGNQYIKWLPDPPEADEDRGTLMIKFWYNHTIRGASNWTRNASVPEWATIRQNYPNADAIDPLLDVVAPEGRGKLILWHGVPGTGKTYAVRGLAWAWRKWCTAHYISDPEAFFSDPGYMMSVLMNNSETDLFEDEDDPLYVPLSYTHSTGDPAGESVQKKNARKWQLLICEDVGELMHTDAHERSGQALSRVLNLTEGLIGQGLRVLLLFTTNEKMTDLHPAVSRPGRCLNEIEFRTFTEVEAREWLEAHGRGDAWATVTNQKGLTLADLYNLIEPKVVGERRKRARVGF